MNKKITGSVLAALMIAGTTSFSAYAAMADGTVVIGSKAYDLKYADDQANIVEISKEVVSGGTVYVKDFNGKWIDVLTSKQVDASVIPAVVYKNAIGVSNFGAADKDQETILSIGAINALTVANGTTAGMIGLPATVAVKLSDTTTGNANIIWDTTAFDGTKAGEITIKGVLSVPTGKTWALTEAQKLVSVKVTVNPIVSTGGGVYYPPTPTIADDLNSATSLPSKSYTITSTAATYGPEDGTHTTVNGDVTVTNTSATSSSLLTLRNMNITGTLTINYGNGDVVLDNVTVNGVNVTNVGNNSLHMKGNTSIGTLTVNDSDNNAHIVVEGNASVTNVQVNSGANIEAIGINPIENMTLSPLNSTSPITLTGTFDTVVVTTSAKVVLDATSEITNQITANAPLVFTAQSGAIVAKVDIQPSNPTDEFTLSGDLSNVNVSDVAIVNITSGTVEISSDTNAAVNIVVNEGATVAVPAGSELADNVTGAGAINTIIINKLLVTLNKGSYSLPITFNDNDTIGEVYEVFRGAISVDTASKVIKPRMDIELARLKTITLSTGENLLKYSADKLEAKGNQKLADALNLYISSNDSSGIITYFKNTSFNDLFDFFNNITTGGNPIIPTLTDKEICVTVTVDGKVVTKHSGDTFNLATAKSYLEIVGNTTLKDLKTKNFEIDVCYGATGDTDPTIFKIQANNGVLTVDGVTILTITQ